MGREARCRVEFNGEVAEGKALLETDELVFRPRVRGVPGKDQRMGEEVRLGL